MGGGGGGGLDLRVVQQPEPRSHWHRSLSNYPPTRSNRSAARLHARKRLELGYKSLITPPLRDMAGIYALRPREPCVYTCHITGGGVINNTYIYIFIT